MSELDDLYDGREQTLVKHRVLDRYLQRFAFIIGSSHDSITYVDCYSGPWGERSADLSDTSFSIAINQLKAAKRELGRYIRLRCLFIEKDPNAYGKLTSPKDAFQHEWKSDRLCLPTTPSNSVNLRSSEKSIRLFFSLSCSHSKVTFDRVDLRLRSHVVSTTPPARSWWSRRTRLGSTANRLIPKTVVSKRV